MSNPTDQNLYVCGSCKRELPQECFYVTKAGQRDRYCKECRRRHSAQRYTTNRRAENRRRRTYPVITQISDPAVRLALIKRALQAVAQSVERRRRKRWELE